MREYESAAYGSETELFLEYVKRSGPFGMGADHFHPYYEIYYLLSGSRIYFIRDRAYPVEAGDLVFIPSYDLHKTTPSRRNEYTHDRLVIHFDDKYARRTFGAHADLLLSVFAQPYRVIRLPDDERRHLAGLMGRVVKELTARPPGFELMLAGAVVETMLTTARCLLAHEPVDTGYATPMHAKISEIVRYVNASFRESLRLEALAAHFYISPHYLSRKFRQATGFTFTDYLALVRVKEAQRLLRDTPLKIAEVAAAAGFPDFSQFGKTFRKVARLSPRDYRKSCGR